MSTKPNDEEGDGDDATDPKLDPNIPQARLPRSTQMDAAGDTSGDPDAEETLDRQAEAWQRHLAAQRGKEQGPQVTESSIAEAKCDSPPQDFMRIPVEKIKPPAVQLWLPLPPLDPPKESDEQPC